MRLNKNLITRYPILTLVIITIVAVISLNLLGKNTIALWVGVITVLLVIGLTAIDMIKSIMRGIFGLDILALVAMIATLAVGEYVAALIIVLMLSGGEALEDYAERRASKELTSLLDKTPQIAHRLVSTAGGIDDGERIEDIDITKVNVDDILIVRPSEIVPVDGILMTEEASLDESSITGESLPVSKRSGEEVFSGVLNGNQAIKIMALRISADSQFQQIIKLVEQAQKSKAPTVRLADRFAVPFTIVSLLIAGIAWAIAGDPLRFAQVLVLATPCPLLIAAPVAFLGGLSRAAKTGVVIKGGSVVEKLARVQSAAFDKTGTLTRGEPELVKVMPQNGFHEDELLLLVASAEQYSSHVLAEGIRKAAIEQGHALLSATEASEQATNGVIAYIDGREIVVGKLAYIQKFASEAERVELAAGELAAYAAIDGLYAGAIVLSDKVRVGAAPLIEWLKTQNISNIMMVTGDSKQTATSIARMLNIQEVHSELLPQDKVDLVHAMQPKPVLMVGDGVNDAPVLAAADVGIAMGARGSTAAGEAADAVILQDSIAKVADAVHISKHTLRIALQAIWIGIIMSIGLMLIATTGMIPAVVGAFMQEVVDLVAILYALRTLNGKPLELNKISRQPLKV
ncbi:MAG TPA: heavy metal translocating P-type ATPase [Microbacteriaceae bacterium]|nr:heavy metal translocating P-type ATPase [Microbacteriaceae bacterium]